MPSSFINPSFFNSGFAQLLGQTEEEKKPINVLTNSVLLSGKDKKKTKPPKRSDSAILKAGEIAGLGERNRTGRGSTILNTGRGVEDIANIFRPKARQILPNGATLLGS